MFREDGQGLDGFAGAVENHVGGIEVDPQVGAIGFFEEGQERGGGFLAGF